jgi:hypothetical protein
MIIVKKEIGELFVPISERWNLLLKMVELKEDYLGYLFGWLEYVGYVPEGVENHYLPEKGIYIECNKRYDADKGYSYLVTMYINDKGLISIADIINENKDELRQFYYKYQN